MCLSRTCFIFPPKIKFKICLLGKYVGNNCGFQIKLTMFFLKCYRVLGLRPMTASFGLMPCITSFSSPKLQLMLYAFTKYYVYCINPLVPTRKEEMKEEA
ncbi:NEDD8-activating enzyme E1 catalytic subunit [Dirofilaria immitis]